MSEPNEGASCIAWAVGPYPAVPRPLKAAYSTPPPSALVSGNDDVRRLRLQLSRNGFFIVPVETGGKRPLQAGWTDRARRLFPEDLEVVNPQCQNTGILCDGLRVVDVDCDDPSMADRLRALALQILGQAPVRVRSNSPRCMLVFRAAQGSPAKRKVGRKGCGVEVLGHGQQFVAFGKHPSGVDYEWQERALTDWNRGQLTAVTEDQVNRFLESACQLISVTFIPQSLGILPESKRNDGLTSLAGALRRKGRTESEIEAELLEQNRRRCQPPLTDEEVRKISASIAISDRWPRPLGEGMAGDGSSQSLPVELYNVPRTLPKPARGPGRKPNSAAA